MTATVSSAGGLASLGGALELGGMPAPADAPEAGPSDALLQGGELFAGGVELSDLLCHPLRVASSRR